MSKVNDKSVGFVQSTAVLMANGNVKPIEKIRPGDWVMSFDTHSPRSPLEPKRVIDTIDYISRDVMEVISGEDAIIVGRGQRFLTPGMDWRFAHETAYITDAEGNSRDFTVSKVNQGNFKIYDIIVDDNHSLVANGFRVHNVSVGNVRTGSVGTAAQVGIGGRVGFSTANPGLEPGAGRVGFSTVGAYRQGKPDSQPAYSYDTQRGGNGKDYFERRDPPPPPPPPPPDLTAQAYAAYTALQETMDYICDIQLTFAGRSFFTVRTAVFEYTKYSKELADDAISHIKRTGIFKKADRSTLEAYHEDITNTLVIIRRSWSEPSVNEVTINLESIKRACLNIKRFVDRSQEILEKYIGRKKSSLEYSIPGLPKPPKVELPTTVVNPQYVKVAADSFVTTLPAKLTVSTTTPAISGGLGTSFTKTRVVRGFLYAFQPKKGWKKVGPADQKALET